MPADESPERYRDPEAWPYTFELLPIDSLFVDRRYQRPVGRMADQIAENLNRLLLGAVLVSIRRDTDPPRHATVDGQNRIEGARRVGERWLWCQVLNLGPDPAPQEALLFADLQRLRKNIKPVEEFKAELFGGRPEAVAIGRILDARDIYVTNFSGFTAPPDAFGAIQEARTIYRQRGEDMLALVLDIATAAWPSARGRYQGDILAALAKFISDERKGRSKLDQERLLRALSEPSLVGSPEALKQKSAAKRTGGTGLGGRSFTYTIQVISEAYRAAGRGRFAKGR
jgi:hypothetical protein